MSKVIPTNQETDMDRSFQAIKGITPVTDLKAAESPSSFYSEVKTATKVNFRRGLKVIDTTAAVLALASLLIAHYEQNDFYTDKSSGFSETGSKPRNSSTEWGNSLRGINMLVVTLLLLCIVKRYYILLKFMKFKGQATRKDTLGTTGLLPLLMIEIAACCLCVPPYFDFTFQGYMMGYSYTYSYDLVIFILMMPRVYLIFRLFGHYSRWASPRAERICKKKNFQPGVIFSLKSEFATRPYIVIGMVFLLFTIVYGVGLAFLERPYNAPAGIACRLDFNDEDNGMWTIMITMATVGYGDGYPSTHFGRVIATMACICGMALFSLVVLSLGIITEFTPQEQKAYFTLRLRKRHDNVENKAADVIKTAMLFFSAQHVKGQKNRIAQGFIHLACLSRAIIKYKGDDLVASNEVIPASDVLHSISKKLNEDVQEICLLVNDIAPILSRMKTLSYNQMRLSKQLDAVMREVDFVAKDLIYAHNCLAEN